MININKTLLLLLMQLIVYSAVTKAAITIPRSYIVEYAQVEDDRQQTHQNIHQELSRYYKDLFQVHHTYSSSIFQGMSLTLKDDHATLPSSSALTPASYTQQDKLHPVFNHLQNHPVIKKIYPIYQVPRPQWQHNQRNVTYPYTNSDTQIYDIHQKLDIQGQDVLIGVLDSGIDYRHLALGGGFGDGFKVKLGKNLVKASQDEKSGIQPRGPDDPFDPCTNVDSGHGTHVSGIIAGYDPEKNFTGIAPKASLGVFRIFGCEGGAGEDTVIKAMEMAYEAGCQVINLSLGIQNAWPEDAMAVVAERISSRGVIVVGVAGNQGSNGVYSQNAPASAQSVISVASIDNSFYLSDVMQLSIAQDDNYPFVPSSSTASFPNGTIAPLTNRDGSIPYGCKEEVFEKDVQGQILFLKRGVCTFTEKLEKAKEVGAIGVLFYDPDVSSKTVIVARTEEGDLPCAGIDLKLATRVIESIQANSEKSISVTFPEKKKIIFPETAGHISEFSSTGPTYELDLKPSITGIGGDVYSALPLNVTDGWGVRSGTSMASPHVAGSAALLINYYAKQGINATSKFIVDQLLNHAKIILSENGKAEHPVVQGAGLVQPYAAILGPLHVSPSQISFNDTASSVEYKTHILTVVNTKDTPLSLQLNNIQSQSIQSYANITSFTPTEPVIKNGSVVVELLFSSTRFTVPAKSHHQIQVKVVLPNQNYHYEMYGGFISFNDTATGESLAAVPYFGVLGRMIDVPVFDKGFPYLATSKNSDKALDSFTYSSNKKAAIVIRLLSGSANIEIKVHDVNGKIIGNMDSGPWLFNQRNQQSEENYRTLIEWNAKVIASNTGGGEAKRVADGTYYLHLRALKHFGNPDYASDWQEWTSGPITIKR